MGYASPTATRAAAKGATEMTNKLTAEAVTDEALMAAMDAILTAAPDGDAETTFIREAAVSLFAANYRPESPAAANAPGVRLALESIAFKLSGRIHAALTRAEGAALRVIRTEAEQAAAEAYGRERCNRCGGSGQYQDLGDCFRCGGSGRDPKFDR